MNALILHPWLAWAIWLLLYASDIGLTMLNARLYKVGASQHLSYAGGLELSPRYQEDVERLRWLSPHFLRGICLLSGEFWLTWLITIQMGFVPDLYEIVLGSWILLELAVHVRHVRNLVMFFYPKDSRGGQGQIIYSAWLSYLISAADVLAFFLLFLILYLLLGRLFLLGGALGCLATAFSHGRLARGSRKAAEG